jgi:hypothetical protein
VRRWGIAAAILAVTLILAGAVVTLENQKREPLKIGIFYYVWYDAPDSSSWSDPKFVDYPVLGNYSSDNSTVIKQHLRWIEDMGVDFVVVSWWGIKDVYGQFTDNAAKQVFTFAREENSSLKFAIMVEPFRCSTYEFKAIYDQVYDYVVSFSDLYYRVDGKPLVCFFNNESLTPDGAVQPDSRFSTVIVGHEPYADWIYTDLNYNARPNSFYRNGEISVTLRYDDSQLGRPRSCAANSDLSDGTCEEEWQNAIRFWSDRKISTVMITSWNEYPERTAIEPHYDGSASNPDPYYMYDLTRNYISGLRNITK